MDFSVIVPAYNAEKTIRECIDSITMQDYKDFEILVIDDGSSDSTFSILKDIKDSKKNNSPEINIFRQKNKGPAAARNLGIRSSRGKFIAFTDADCIVPKDWLKSMKKVFDSYPFIAGVGGIMEPGKDNLIADLERIKYKRFYNAPKTIKIGGLDVLAGGTNNIAYKKDILKEVNGFDEKFKKPCAEDYDLKFRICKKGYKIAFAPIKVIHNEPYDLDYLLRQLQKRGIPFRVSNRFLFAKVIIFLPIIIPVISYRAIKYKIREFFYKNGKKDK